MQVATYICIYVLGTCMCAYTTDVKWYFKYVAVFDHIRSLLLRMYIGV